MATTAKPVTLGLDIGGTRLKAVALDERDEIVHQLEIASAAAQGPRAVRSSLGEAVAGFTAQGFVPTSIGVGCAGSVHSATGVVRNSPNFAQWKDIPLQAWVEQDFGVTACVDNDANCATVAEWKLGAAKGLSHFLLLTLGTGVGGGLVLDNRLYRGNTGTAGELGHFSIYTNGDPCPCGSTGCLERYCSGTAIRRHAGDISSKVVFSDPTHPPFAAVIERFLVDFRAALVSLANVFDPQAILLGGQVSLGVLPYLPELQEWVSAHAFPSVGASLQLRPAHYGNLSGSLGAALLAKERR